MADQLVHHSNCGSLVLTGYKGGRPTPAASARAYRQGPGDPDNQLLDVLGRGGVRKPGPLAQRAEPSWDAEMADAEALVRRDGKMIHPGDSPIVRQRRPCRRSQGVFDQGGAGIVGCLRISRTVHCLCLRTGHHRRGTCELPASRCHTFRQLPFAHPGSHARPMACRKLAARVNSESPPLVDGRTA